MPKDKTKNTSPINVLKDVAAMPVEALQKATSPLMVEFKIRDALQIIVGASLLAVPVAFTEETWNLGSQLPLKNVLGLAAVSLIFIGLFVYYNYYRRILKKNWMEFAKRVASTYLFSLIVVAGLLSIIQVTPWATDWVLALKRVILVAFPASMSAVVADTIK